jgi:replicative DNA helicase
MYNPFVYVERDKRTVGRKGFKYYGGKEFNLSVKENEMREIPHNIEAEEAVNGSLLIGAIPNTDLSPDDFYSEKNKYIFQACLDLYKSNTTIDQITVSNRLNEIKKLDKVGVSYLSHLISITPTHFDFDYYAEIVKKCSIYRKMIVIADKITGIGYEAAGDVNGDINNVINLSKSLNSDTKTKLYTGQDLAESILSISNQELDRILTPWGDINRVTGGLFGGELTVLGAWTGQGKTEFVLQLLLWLAKKGYPVLLASLEMLKDQVAQRIVSIETGIPGIKLKNWDLTGDELGKVADVAGMVSELSTLKQLFCGASLQGIRATLDRSDDKIKLVVIDYLTTLPEFFNKRFGDSPREQMNYITHTLKTIARDYNTHVLAISQFARKDLERKGSDDKSTDGKGSKSYPEPHPSYFKESGSIEQEADNIWTLYRPELNDLHKPEDEGKTFFKQHKTRSSGDDINSYKKIPLIWKNHKLYGVSDAYKNE